MFDEAVRTPGPPGAEDDVLIDESGSGQPDDLEATTLLEKALLNCP